MLIACCGLVYCLLCSIFVSSCFDVCWVNCALLASLWWFGFLDLLCFVVVGCGVVLLGVLVCVFCWFGWTCMVCSLVLVLGLRVCLGFLNCFWSFTIGWVLTFVGLWATASCGLLLGGWVCGCVACLCFVIVVIVELWFVVVGLVGFGLMVVAVTGLGLCFSFDYDIVFVCFVARLVWLIVTSSGLAGFVLLGWWVYRLVLGTWWFVVCVWSSWLGCVLLVCFDVFWFVSGMGVVGGCFLRCLPWFFGCLRVWVGWVGSRFCGLLWCEFWFEFCDA